MSYETYPTTRGCWCAGLHLPIQPDAVKQAQRRYWLSRFSDLPAKKRAERLLLDLFAVEPWRAFLAKGFAALSAVFTKFDAQKLVARNGTSPPGFLFSVARLNSFSPFTTKGADSAKILAQAWA